MIMIIVVIIVAIIIIIIVVVVVVQVYVYIYIYIHTAASIATDFAVCASNTCTLLSLRLCFPWSQTRLD